MTKNLMVLALAAVFAVTLAAEAMAGKGQGGGSRSGAGSASVTRPVDSQRRDGTFLTTGTTANGSITRPDHGNGLRDGSRLNTTPAE